MELGNNAKGERKIGETPSLKELVYTALRTRIINGELPPGSKLLEEELSNQMGISRAPLREALNMLGRDGFAVITPRRGAVVSEVNPSDVQDLWDIRELLEPAAAVMSLPFIPQEQAIAVEAQLKVVQENPGLFELYAETDISVHTLLTDYLQNRYLSDILKNIKDHSLRVRWNAERQSENDGKEMVLAATAEHAAIVQAILARDEAKLHQAVLTHIQTSRDRTAKQLQP